MRSISWMAVVMVAGLAACGGGEREAGPSRAAPGRLETLPPYERPSPPEGYTARASPALWQLERVEADDRTLVVHVATGSCLKFDHMTLEGADDSAVVLRGSNQQWEPGEGQGCEDDLRVETFRVRLPETVRDRRVEGQCTPGDASAAQRQCTAVAGSVQRARAGG